MAEEKDGLNGYKNNYFSETYAVKNSELNA